MRNSKPTLALAAIFAVCGLFLASCGGGSGSGSSATTINGISVPPEPDATQNNATVAGVDSNSNGVRDDVEREIANKWPKDYKEVTLAASVYQKIVTAQPVSDADDKAAFCILANSSISSNSIADLILNNTDRYAAYADNVGVKKVWECQ